MSAGADVVMQVRMTKESVELAKQMTEAAVRRALERVLAELPSLAAKYTPVVTGKLLSSFDASMTPRSIVMEWDAEDDGFHYAEVVEKGRFDYRPFPGRYYAQGVKNEIHDRMRMYLLEELTAVQVP